jgi:small GTP-binding protein
MIADTPGNANIKNVTASIMRDIAAAFVVFDITDKKSFTQQADWIELIGMNNKNPHMVVVLVGNKTDKGTREVSEEEASELAATYDIPYYEVSAKTGEQIEVMFQLAADLVSK